jgi:hypothetical protein
MSQICCWPGLCGGRANLRYEWRWVPASCALIRQVLVESVLLALFGGALGLLLASWGTVAAIRLLPGTLPRAEEIGVDTRALAFTLAISVLSGIIFGLVPALKTVQPNLQATLKEGGSRRERHVRSRAQRIFVVVEMATALVLLVGAGLMVRSLARLWSVDPGFHPKNVLVFQVALPPPMGAAAPDAIRANLRQLHEAIAGVPGSCGCVHATWRASNVRRFRRPLLD